MAERRLDGRGALLVADAGMPVAGAIADALARAGAQVETTGPDAFDADRATGSLDIVVHCAPPAHVAPFLERSDAAWAADIDARIGRPIRLARAAALRMARTGGGVLVFVGTLDATHAYPGHADASVAMGALGGLIRSLAVELAPVGVRANAVFAGPVEPTTGTGDGGLRDRTLLRSPSGRFVRPEEVGAAVAFVASDDAGFMSGATLRVDAGWASLNQAPDGMRFP